MGRRPELDALRAFAALAVFVRHAELDVLPGGGWVGVTTFLTLSGFLITSLLLRELDEHGTIGVKRFYVRRARRLLPALVVFIPVVAIAAAAAGDRTLQVVPHAALYAGNVPKATDMGFLGHMWSLAVEEHFYIVWPAVFLVTVRFRPQHLLRVTVALAGLSMLLRVSATLVGTNFQHLQRGTHYQVELVLIGCALAILMRDRKVSSSAPWQVWAAVLVGFALIDPGRSTPFIGAVGFTGTAIAAAGLITAWTGRPPRVPSALAGAGRMTYAFYLWHVPLLWWVNRQPWSSSKTETIVVGFALTLLFTGISWVAVERRFLRASGRSAAPSVQGLPVPSPA